MLLRLLQVICIKYFLDATVFASAQVAITCPGPNEKPVILSETSGAELSLPYGASDRVCILAHVHAGHHNDDKALANMRIYSSKDDYLIVPVARSYDQQPWQKTAGKFAALSTVGNCDDVTKMCTVTLPAVDASLRLADGHFVLFGFEHSLQSFDEELSRFFLKTTFGPTLGMISDFKTTYTNNVAGMANWLLNQIQQVPSTLHRVYWRERAHHAVDDAFNTFTEEMTREPCKAYSIWYDYAFDERDWNGPTVQLLNFAGKEYVNVDAKTRTMLDGRFIMESTGQPFPYGTYKISSQFFGSYAGGRVRLQGQGVEDYIQGGNPRIKIPPEILDFAGNYHLLNFPGAKDDQATFEYIPPIRTKYGMKGREGYRLKSDIAAGNGCEAIEAGGFKGLDGKVVGKLPDYGTTWAVLRHGANLKLRENSLESPCVGGDCQYINIRMHPITEDGCVVDSSSSVTIPEVRCGSAGEVVNKRDQDPSQTNIFMFTNYVNWFFWENAYFGKVYVFHNIAQFAQDQFRQRVGWVLAQMYPITAESFANAFRDNESFLNYYDIFVRNAFGSMKDLLTQVSFHPMMGKFLTYVDSRSPYYKERYSGFIGSNADENYARELMQLFTIGLDKLNRDGTPVVENGVVVPAYTQRHVRNFARAWTGFTNAAKRINVEQYVEVANKFDNMWINGVERDPFPKIDTLNGYIGDGYPLCNDLPEKHWLRKGARYRFQGGNGRPELGEQDNARYYTDWAYLRADMTLATGSPLYGVLCNAGTSGDCNYNINVILESHLACFGNECNVEMPRVVKVGEVFYEYVRPACVNLPFSTDVSSVISKSGKFACADKNDNESVQFACCKDSNVLQHTCRFSGSRVSYDENTAMCSAFFGASGSICDGMGEIQISGEGLLYPKQDGSIDSLSCFATGGQVDPLYWQGSTCSIKMKVNNEGQIAIVHKSDTAHTATHLMAVDQESPFYFDVVWPETGSYPAPSNNCNNFSSACDMHAEYCLCDIDMTESQVFTTNPSSAEELMDSLKVGHPSVDMFDAGSFSEEVTSSGYTIYRPTGSSGLTKETLFKVVTNGRTIFYKNMIPQVTIPGGISISIRNPPTFLNLINPVGRDAFYETEAVIDHFFYHPNSPTFFALNFIKRLGTSNPSPDYVSTVDQAYRDGSFEKDGVVFGDGSYGNLEATFASVMLHADATTVAVDADPFSGNLREPTLSYHAFMRSMELEPAADSPYLELWLDNNGEEMFYGPGVFGFFDSNYEPDGTFNAAGLVSAEASVYNPIRAMRMMNALSSLVENGLTNCFEGIGQKTNDVVNCDSFAVQPELRDQQRAVLRYTPTSTNPKDVVDEMAMLLTGGRLNYYSKKVLTEEFQDSIDASQPFSDALRMTQRLMTVVPEFHSSGLVKPSLRGREGYTPRPPSTGENYKAVVFMYLNGGMDGFNALVPHSECQNGKDMYAEYASVRSYNALAKNTLRQINVPASTPQVCNKFGLHPKLERAHQLYELGDLSFVANVGLLGELCNDQNWNDKTPFLTKAHNLQRTETLRLDVRKEHPGKGVSGRLLDALQTEGYQVHGVQVGPWGKQTMESYDSPSLTMSNTGEFEQFGPMQWIERKDELLHSVTNTTALGSSRFSDIWGSGLKSGIEENAFIKSKVGNVNLQGTYSNEFSLIEHMIQTAASRGVEREIFFTEMLGWDMHFDVVNALDAKLTAVDDILMNFETNMKAQGRWDDTTLVIFSDFGRDLTMNGGNGTDHGWGSNLFFAGGAVKGGQILGTYPDDLTNQSPHVMAGTVIPTTPFDSMWNSIAQWMGVTTDAGLDLVAPNRNSFPTEYLWDKNIMFDAVP